MSTKTENLEMTILKDEDVGIVDAMNENFQKVDAAVSELNESLGGFSFYNNPNIIYLVENNTAYTDDNGNYVLSNSLMGISLLSMPDIYYEDVLEGDYRSVGGADTVTPFNKLASGTFKEIGIIASTSTNNKFRIELDSNGRVNTGNGEYLYTWSSGDSAWIRVLKDCTCYVYKDGSILYDSELLSAGTQWGKSVQYTGTVVICVIE